MLLLGAGALIVGLIIVLGTCIYSIVRQRRANRRAVQLLDKLLDPTELAKLRAVGYLEVQSRSTPGRRYRIPQQPGFVTVFDEGIPVLCLCSQPTTTLPAAEYVLLHKILLEGAEDDYWTHANRLRGRMILGQDDGHVEVWTGRGPGLLSQR